MIVAASVQDEINGIINVCTGKPMSLAERVKQFLKDKNYKIRLNYGAFPDRPYDSPGTWGDPAKINKILYHGYLQKSIKEHKRKNAMKRLGIFFFFRKNGDVDDFITYYLADLNKNLTELVVVCNGKLSAQGRAAFEQFTDNIIVRREQGPRRLGLQNGAGFLRLGEAH